MEAIEAAYPGLRREHVHVWTLGGKTRAVRIGKLWDEWRAAGAHLVEDGWTLPSGMKAFTESGTYAPTYRIGPWTDDEGRTHLFLCDGYAASAEAMQAASLAPMLDLDASLAVFTSKFDLPHDCELHIMHLDPDAPDFADRLADRLGHPVDDAGQTAYRELILEARDAGVPLERPVIAADDFFPEKRWEVAAFSGYMRDDPYTGAAGVEELGPGVYRVGVRLATARGDKHVTFTLRLMEKLQESRLVFNPAAHPLHLRRGLPHPAGEDLRLGPHPQRIADPVLRGHRVRGPAADAHPLRPHPARGDPARPAAGRAGGAALVQAAPPAVVLVAEGGRPGRDGLTAALHPRRAAR